jgi:hypothetical protein
MTFTYDRLPSHMREAAQLYIEHGVEPGSFLRAVLENNLCEAASRADATNLIFLHDYAWWLYNDIPASAWGSPAKVSAWILEGGLNGKA